MRKDNYNVQMYGFWMRGFLNTSGYFNIFWIYRFPMCGYADVRCADFKCADYRWADFEWL